MQANLPANTDIACTIPATTGPIYYQCQAGTERSDVVTCKACTVENSNTLLEDFVKLLNVLLY